MQQQSLGHQRSIVKQKYAAVQQDQLFNRELWASQQLKRHRTTHVVRNQRQRPESAVLCHRNRDVGLLEQRVVVILRLIGIAVAEEIEQDQPPLWGQQRHERRVIEA